VLFLRFYLLRCEKSSTFADGFENKFSGKLKSMFSFSNLLKRDLTIGKEEEKV